MNNLSVSWDGLGLRGRLLAMIVLLLVLSGVVSHSVQLWREADDYRADLSHDMNHTMDLLEISLMEHAITGDFAAIQRALTLRAQYSLIAEIQWRDPSGVVVKAQAIKPETAAYPPWFHRLFGFNPSEQLRGVVVGERNYGVIAATFSSVPLENRLWREATSQLWQSSLGLALLMLVVYLLLGRWLKPLKSITAMGHHLLAGDYRGGIAGSSRFVPEIRDMARILDQAATEVGRLVLSLSEQRRAIDNAVVVIESDLKGIISYVNDKFCEVSGYSREEVIGHDHRFLNSGLHLREFFDGLWEDLRRGEVWHGEVCNRTKSGGLFWLLTTITPILGPDGKPLKYISVRVDITQRKLVEGVMSQQAQIINQTHDAVFSTDSKGTLVSWNRGAELLFGHDGDGAIGEPVQFIALPGEQERFYRQVFLGLIRSSGGALETRLAKKSGEPFDAYFSLSLLKDKEGMEIGVACYVTDISARKRMEHKLRESEMRLAKAQQMARLGNWEWEIATGEIQWSDEVYRIFGVDRDTPVTFDLFLSRVHPEDRELVEKSLTAALAREVNYNVDVRLFPAGGEVRFIHAEAEVEFDGGGKALRMFGTVQDITERKEIEQEIRASREQLRELSSHLQAAREEEKATIAREIHDELGGNLTALKMDIFWLARKLPPEMEAELEKTRSMADLVDTSVHAMRRIVTELRPTVLDDLGLLAAMCWQASEFTKRYGIQCKVVMHGEEIAVEGAYRIALFRIFQESLTNAARYSKADLVLVDVWREHDKIAMDIVDNGIGLPEDKAMDPTSHGLRGMMERARTLGGTLEVGSAPGEGVAISVRIPFPSRSQPMRSFQQEMRGGQHD
ncbi:hypothetical protein SCT_2798 [Sulfuricella sp. T08]|uniref:PAS domain S-box protein n=1 Tax=Sulfuricella sp. T08 TaxID=1632857 RepID=UPI0006179D50|nr:PAS domain S-box protein [Sulfuricella sp. T08]GAO37377.1 hypothetical protein SCT_2798 [Sulfuricella sp. T08]